MANRMDRTANDAIAITNPPIADALFSSTRWAPWLWLVLRLYIGYTWITSSLEKLDNPAWMVTGAALKGFWTNAVKIPEAPARPAIAFDWYRNFLAGLLNAQAYTWFAKLIAIGEITVGILLIIGAFVGIFAFLGAFLNWNFMMAGTASINPVMFVVTILLILAWKNAGWIGLDRWILPALGTPWEPGRVFATEKLRQDKIAEKNNAGPRRGA